ncbi:MAG: two-component sensor histidine kinase [Bacteroidetes bacterium]|nr:two-component sensor histidine kinase [Bacteroidota bacterium]
MKPYQKYNNWRWYVAVAAALIVGLSIWYTSFLVDRLKESERNKVEIFKYSIQSLAKASMDDLDKDITLQYEASIRAAEGIPMLLVDEVGNISGAYNFSDSLTEKEQKQWLKKIKQDGPEPIVNDDPYAGYAKYIYYTQSRTLQLLSYFPIIQVLLLTVFIGISYMGLRASRKEQQNRIWVGMAKETAHQLGTPISAIMAWLELLKGMEIKDDEVIDILGELKNDVGRLELIADRFSKMGSRPELQETDIRPSLQKIVSYMSKRAPKKVQFHYEAPDEAIRVRINPPVFEWVIENLIRNSLDALEGSGEIEIDVIDLKKEVQIDLSDTGKGISSKQHKQVFKPGYSTKKRGWGLGLSLAKRIVEEYHNGEIFVKRSSPGEGATFSIVLPKSR